MADIKAHSSQKQMQFAHDKLTIQWIVPKHSKPIIDSIDRLIGQYLEFSDEEIDFVNSYDIKYRMGGDLQDDEE